MKMILTILVVTTLCGCGSQEQQNTQQSFADHLVAADYIDAAETRLHEAREGDIEACHVDGITTEVVSGFTAYDSENRARAGGIICRMTATGNLFGQMTWGN
ncbi:MAG: hypothetical protein ACJKSS_01820 [Patescibacteria group bacterium UBA2103]